MSRELHVEPSSCTRCGACAAACPGVFDVTGESSRLARAPLPSERRLVEAARWICPTDAIRGGLHEEASAPPAESAIFDALATGAERVRWSLESIPWEKLEAARAPAELRAVVREMAFSENATYSATQRFLEAFFDDVELTQWIAVWFYEETRHPHVLLEWLRRLGEPVAGDFVLKGRISTPFMRSPVGTLVTNVISELTAAQSYGHLARTSPEPVMSEIARRIAGDEARHAASFFRFARRTLSAESREAARRSRARGLEVLQAWLGGAAQTTHPVAQMLDRLGDGALDLDFAAVRTRVVRVVGLLLDIPLRREDDVALVLREALRGT